MISLLSFIETEKKHKRLFLHGQYLLCMKQLTFMIKLF